MLVNKKRLIEIITLDTRKKVEMKEEDSLELREIYVRVYKPVVEGLSSPRVPFDPREIPFAVY